ncbi:hypothetical protein GCM10007939_20650 [Amylibacter marinus]|uniref:Uncharacterized protein n=1 Tax=Amylibacter marinus TaxID=1475483 RepID=A0ABQ5VWV8_9RHOB|nr:hypothetical protein [Amylibacter marinus]GLQ35782.1 hypothetical protein GCM10007939_20650 [Amylibacter marinus]
MKLQRMATALAALAFLAAACAPITPETAQNRTYLPSTGNLR